MARGEEATLGATAARSQPVWPPRTTCESPSAAQIKKNTRQNRALNKQKRTAKLGLLEQVAQDVVQNAAVFVVGNLNLGIKARKRLERD